MCICVLLEKEAMTDITESIQNEEESGAEKDKGMVKGSKLQTENENIREGAREIDQLDRLRAEEPKDREEIGSPPVEHTRNGNPGERDI